MGENIYYTNSPQIPVDYTDDPFEALMLQDELQTKYTGGTVLHLVHEGKNILSGSLSSIDQESPVQLQAALHHCDAGIQHMTSAWLPEWRT